MLAAIHSFSNGCDDIEIVELLITEGNEEGRIIRNQHELLTGHNKDCCRLYTKQILFREDCHMYNG